MSNILNSKLLQLISGMDRSKIEEASKMIGNMSKDDLNNLVNILSKNINNSNNNSNSN